MKIYECFISSFPSLKPFVHHIDVAPVHQTPHEASHQLQHQPPHEHHQPPHEHHQPPYELIPQPNHEPQHQAPHEHHQRPHEHIPQQNHEPQHQAPHENLPNPPLKEAVQSPHKAISEHFPRSHPPHEDTSHSPHANVPQPPHLQDTPHEDISPMAAEVGGTPRDVNAVNIPAAPVFPVNDVESSFITTGTFFN
ncbi:early nodulin-75 [Eurytemora carolleeae]|uniref:early nodulin-75 n=1 Tax=Eurytemora carolleeae TaxID=1294199 RepID=UPI000C790302|nr:early nodulin-75 [Eurytemora carolleeae]|eukprot:XP_023343786.1 early nodulin-75-like [Eurytemora affinis]